MRHLAGQYQITDEKLIFLSSTFLEGKEIVEVEKETLIKTSTSEKYIITTSSNEKYFAKQVPYYADDDIKIKQRMDFLSFLLKNKFPVPQFISIKNGQLYEKFQSKSWYVYPFINGNIYNKDKNSIFDSINFLAKFHNLSLNYSKIYEDNENKYFDLAFKKIFILFKLLNSEESNNGLTKILFSNIENLKKKYKVLFKSTSNLFIMIHGDFSHNNLLFNDSGPVAMLDFDNCDYHSPIRDLSEIIITTNLFEYETNSTFFSNKIPSLDGVNFSNYLSYYTNKIIDFKISDKFFYANFLALYTELVILGFLRKDFQFNAVNLNYFTKQISNFFDNYIK